MNLRDFVINDLGMTARDFLLHLRMLEVMLLMGCFYWILFYEQRKRVRSIRLALTGVFAMINLVAILVVTGAGATLW